MMRKMGGADDLDDSEIYASLLNRGYLMAAFNMANDAEDGDLLGYGMDADGWPILLLAAAQGEYDLIEDLVDAGVACDATTAEGSTVFHVIAGSADDPPGHDILRKLVAHGANPDEADAFGTLPIEEAAAKGNLLAVARLIEIGADVTATDLNAGELAKTLEAAGFNEAARLITSKAKSPAKAKTPGGLQNGPARKGVRGLKKKRPRNRGR
jgi:hypothetical protein